MNEHVLERLPKYIRDSAILTEESFQRAIDTHNNPQANQSQPLVIDTDVEKFINSSYHRSRILHDRAVALSDDCARQLTNAHREQIWPEDIQKSVTWGGDDDVTEEVQGWVDAVIQMEDPIWDSYEGVPMAAANTIKGHLQDSLRQHQGWSLNSIVNRLRNDFPRMSKKQAETIARQEVAGTINRAKIDQLLARKEDPMVRWIGPGDQDSTELCKDLEQESKSGMPLSEFMETMEEYTRRYDEGTPERAKQGLPHFQCRYTIEWLDE